MGLYRLFSLIKIVVGVVITLSVYFLIDPFVDPVVALSGMMLGIFLIAWGGSFFAFLGRNSLYRKISITQDLLMHSYKLSLLFGLYILCNIVFLLKHTWSFVLGLLLLIGFVILQHFALPHQK